MTGISWLQSAQLAAVEQSESIERKWGLRRSCILSEIPKHFSRDPGSIETLPNPVVSRRRGVGCGRALAHRVADAFG